MTVLLVRHARTAISDRVLAGRAPGVHLSREGRRHARALAGRLEGTPLQAIYASPAERARETAEPLARLRRLPIRTCAGVAEIDYGDWTGRTFDELAGDPRWRAYHRSARALPIPGGEWIPGAQRRVVAALKRLARGHPGATVAVFTHRDVIRLAVAWLGGIPLGDLDRLEAGYASVTPLDLDRPTSRSPWSDAWKKSGGVA